MLGLLSQSKYNIKDDAKDRDEKVENPLCLESYILQFTGACCRQRIHAPVMRPKCGQNEHLFRIKRVTHFSIRCFTIFSFCLSVVVSYVVNFTCLVVRSLARNFTSRRTLCVMCVCVAVACTLMSHRRCCESLTHHSCCLKVTRRNAEYDGKYLHLELKIKANVAFGFPWCKYNLLSLMVARRREYEESGKWARSKKNIVECEMKYVPSKWSQWTKILFVSDFVCVCDCTTSFK